MANGYDWNAYQQALRQQTGYTGGFAPHEYLNWLAGQPYGTQQSAFDVIRGNPYGLQPTMDYLTSIGGLASAPAPAAPAPPPQQTVGGPLPPAQSFQPAVPNWDQYVEPTQPTPAEDAYSQMEQQFRQQTGYQGQFGGNQALDWLGQQSPDVQNTGLGIIAQTPGGAQSAADYLVQNQPAQSDRVPRDPGQTPAVSPQWQQWASAFGLDPSRWEGYGVDTGSTVNPWDPVEQFGVPQGVLRAALNQLGFAQDYGFGRGQAAIDMFGESNVADMIRQLGYEPQMAGQAAPQAAANITAYQPNFASFYNPVSMAEQTMGGVPISFQSPLYRSTMVPYGEQAQAQPAAAGGPPEGAMWDAQGYPTQDNPLLRQFMEWRGGEQGYNWYPRENPNTAPINLPEWMRYPDLSGQ